MIKCAKIDICRLLKKIVKAIENYAMIQKSWSQIKKKWFSYTETIIENLVKIRWKWVECAKNWLKIMKKCWTMGENWPKIRKKKNR